MKLIKNVRVIPAIYADVPANFEELIGGNMGYELQGDSYYIHRDWVLMADISPEFKNTHIYNDLWQLFTNNTEDFILLSPR